MFSGRILVALLIVGPTLQAQDAVRSDTTPFRRGQWAAQFGGGFSFASLGAIRFRSPTSAMVLDLQVSGFHREQFVNDTLTSMGSNASFDLRLGRRWYRPIADKIVALHSLGVLAGFNHNVSTSPSFGRTSSNGWNAGPFGELGAVYLVTPHLGIGATATASLAYAWSSGKTPSGFTFSSWELYANTGVAFAATIYF